MRPLFMLLWAFVLPIANKLQAQTLQFSQVLLVSTTQTVPANKVWKVESPLPSWGGGATTNTITIDGNLVVVTIGGSSSVSGISFPIWLPAGTSLAAGQNIPRISVIEFTVVP